MLVLSRKVNEKIYLDWNGERVEVVLIELRDRGKARLGINAPRHVRIMRAELLDEEPSPPETPQAEGLPPTH